MYNTVTKYYYILNAQGDVIELRQADGSLQCRYTYDAWGKILLDVMRHVPKNL